MNPLAHLSLRVRIFLFFAALAIGAVAALFTGLYLAYHRLADASLLDPFVQGGIVAGFAILGLLAWVWYLFDMNVAKPIETLAGALRARAHADGAGELDASVARYLGDLAPAARAAARRLDETQSALAMAVARETTRLAEEKARLEALLADVPVGVVLCNPGHDIVFYNGPAVQLLGAASSTPGLDRTLFDTLNDGPVRMAFNRLVALHDAEAATDFLCTTKDGLRLLAARMRFLGDDEGATGYVLTLRDVSAESARHASREAFLDEIFDRIRRPAAALTTLAETLSGTAAPKLVAALQQESSALAQSIKAFSTRRDAARVTAWPLPLTRASDLAEGLKSAMEAQGLALSATMPDLFLRLNAFDVMSLLAQCAKGLTEAGHATAFALSLREEEGGATLLLSWQGQPCPMALLDQMLDAPAAAGSVPLRAILSAHRTDIWPETHEGRPALALPILRIRHATRRPDPVPRAVTYDFDLLSRERTAAVSGAALDSLNYVVFDTETTGLLPEQGDEIVQIAAIRIVNGRRAAGEVFDMLVNPGRKIPAASTEVHGISDAMVLDAAPVSEALKRFHRFAEGAVLVAHNAPFDMTFLKRREAELGLKFDHPVLDTVLLSAVVYGQHEVHSLDALSHRLGITIPEELRHTALGDTEATADAFLRLLSMMKGRGILTFADALTEVRKHGRLLKDLN
ncbi:MAG: PAS domain-containing protein [Rhodobacteraceae bacterium]|nr:PAS domain-containing protein [Paracoccaceae bacterium]